MLKRIILLLLTVGLLGLRASLENSHTSVARIHAAAKITSNSSFEAQFKKV